jgi:hypothetical protein
MSRKQLFLIAAVVAVFVLVAIGGSIITTLNMNKGADEHGMSAGRSGDAYPNAIQEHQMDRSARGPSTSGSKTEGAVPPASR